MWPLGLVLLVLSLPPFFDFPFVDFWMLPLAGVYLALLFVLPRLWLVVLPLATVLVDIVPWTGRAIYNEFDFLFLLTLVSGLLYNHYRITVYTPTPATLTLLCFLVIMVLGFHAWAVFLMPPEAVWGNPYFTAEYAYKVTKGPLWGIALVPMWGYLLAVDKRRAVNWLIVGMTLAAIFLGLVVLWERGTLGVMMRWSAWYHIINSLLDLSASYRVTGLFSDMHTGGEVIDGVLVLLLPVTLHAITWGNSTPLRLMGVAGLLALSYVALVGFTRTTYVAFALGVCVYGLLALRYRRAAGMPLELPVKWLGLTLLAAILAAIPAYQFAGSYGLASFGCLLVLAYIFSRIEQSRKSLVILVLLAVSIVGLALNAHLSSRWVDRSVLASLILIVTLPLTLLAALPLFRRSRQISELNRLLVLVMLIVLPAFSAFTLGGFQFGQRMDRVGSDLQTRGGHWVEVVRSGRDGIWYQLLGNGMGSFPARYAAAHPDKEKETMSFIVPRDDRSTVLRLRGGGVSAQSDVMGQVLGQRVTVEPYTDYLVNLRFKATEPGKLVLALCQRNILYASNSTPRCAHETITIEADEAAFQEVEVSIHSGKIGARGPLSRWPTLLTLSNRKEGQLLEIDSIQLSADGFNVLRNSSFRQGLDYWYFYDDFSHLNWHVKNTFLLVWFEMGWLGLGLFIALITLLVRSTFRRHAADSLMPVYLTAVLTLCVSGMLGSPLDSPRVSWLFYFFLAAGLARLRVRLRKKGDKWTRHASR